MKSVVGAAVVATMLVAAACARPEPSDPPPALTADGLAAALSPAALSEHLHRLQQIAGEHDDNRAVGTAGYDAGLDYVRDRLTERGFRVQTQDFDAVTYAVTAHRLSSAAQEFPAIPLKYSPATPAAGLTARTIRVAGGERPGCAAADYAGLDLAGAIVAIPRGGCTFEQKQDLAADRGAVAALIVDPNGPLLSGILGEPDAGRIPVLGIAADDADRLLSTAAPATLVLAATTTHTPTRNLIAQTDTGNTDNVVLVGAHLDSVPVGPGINDNGTGVAAVLETALQLGSAPPVQNAVRFVWWGAEELGLLGSRHYVDAMSEDELTKVALYLNFDMLGSPNYGYFAYDGDDSDADGAPAGPPGSAGIERTLAGYLHDRQHVEVAGTDFDGRSDYGPFMARGIPAGGVDSGADASKTAAQVATWGGAAGEPFDPNYHTAADTVDNVNLDAFVRNSRAVAFGTATYALSVGGPDGVPVGPERIHARSGHA
ncbi:M28 family peptidase [Skermania piniformis]|uniref:M28 family peptidase n=1 Tax=Skermania pinensis TaxID=39122 RepID=A0ABX8S8T0_9ACTN|nr:M28 family peptidase [Skermania piniformis]QXQ14260.1 M28 family peptidase [Skermania piniformis]